MTDETKSTTEESSTVANDATVEKKQYDDLVARFNSLEESNKSLMEHKNTILNEKKQEQAKRVQAEESKLKKAGDFEQLLKSSQSKNAELELQLKEISTKVSKEKINTEAMKMATSIADGANAEILSKFIAERMRYTDDGLKVLDKDGLLTVSSVDDLKRDFENSDKFKSLLRGNQSTGGGASGSNNSVGAIKEMKRLQFDKLNMKERHNHIVKNKGTVKD